MSVVKGVDFTQDGFRLYVPEMELLDQGVTALVGPSGSGKSTLIRVLLGLERIAGWSWNFQGVDLAKLSVEKRNFGVVFQSLELFPHLSALENILFPLRCRGRLTSKDPDKANSLLDRLQISKCKDRKPHTLSGGEKQRVALARALVFKPRFLFLDEPFSSLDQDIKVASRGLVKEILREEKVPALLVSHDMNDIADLSSKVYRIEAGHLVEG